MDATRALSADYSQNARAYAQAWAPVLHAMSRPILEKLPLREAKRVVDIGCGTGAMLPDVGARAPRASIIGVDRAEGMLRVAGGAARFPVAVADGRELCIRTGSIDVVILIFVLFHLPDPRECLREVARVLARDGCAGIVVWGVDPGAPGASIWTEELNREGAAPDPRHESVRQLGLMNTTEKLAQLIGEGGLAVTRVWGEIVSHRWSFEGLLTYQLACGSAARRLPSLDMEARARCESRVRKRIAELREAALEYKPEVLFAVAHQQ